MGDVHEVQLHVQPHDAGSVTVNLEPTGMQYRLEPGEAIRVVIKGPGTGVADIVHLADTVVICSWAGGEMSAFDPEGKELPV